MDTLPIIIERNYNASVASVWYALTSREDMEQWYFKLEKFKPETDFEFQRWLLIIQIPKLSAAEI